MIGTASCEHSATPTEPLAPPVYSTTIKLSETSHLALARWKPEAAQQLRLLAPREQTVGETGGAVSLGPITLIVPPSAVAEPTRFGIHLKLESTDRAVVELTPHNLRFGSAVRVEFALGLTNALDKDMSIVRWDGSAWTRIPTQFTGSKASAEVEHFSDFGVAFCMPTLPGEEDGCREPVPDLVPGANGIYVNGWSRDQCMGSIGSSWWLDHDLDGVHDICEQDIAYAFRPLLRTYSDCNWDEFHDRLGGEYFWGVDIDSFRGARGTLIPGDLAIAYLPAYYWDCGNGQPFGGGHTGDSELIAVSLDFQSFSNHWEMKRTFLSAHCGRLTGEKCHRFSDFDAYVDGTPRGAPVVWVSWGKHANYVSREECNWEYKTSAHQWTQVDFCPPNFASRRLPVNLFLNIGSRSVPLIDETSGFWPTEMRTPGSTEHLWSLPPSGKFRGWQGGGDGATPYTTLLGNHLEW